MPKLFARLLSWLSRESRLPPGRVQIRVYTRAGCHLCEEAWDLLRAEQRRWHFTLDGVDVDADPVLVARYGDAVPVVTVNGRERFRGRVNWVLLRRLLKAEAELPGPNGG